VETFSTKIVNNIQEWRSRKLEKSAHFLLNIGISANVLTFFALLCGLLAVYFLFNNTFLFLLFALLHLLADAFDGVIARLTTTTSLGKFFDHILSDGLVTILPIIKMGFFLNDLYAYLAAGLDDRAVAEEAMRRDVVVRPLSPLYIDAAPCSGLDIGFTGFDHARMQLAAVRLGEALRQVAKAA